MCVLHKGYPSAPSNDSKPKVLSAVEESALYRFYSPLIIAQSGGGSSHAADKKLQIDSFRPSAPLEQLEHLKHGE
jgi:hypothetical protein